VAVANALEGTIVSYAITDGVGRIELDDGEELRFSIRAMRGVVPAVGLRVSVNATEPHPLGGRRALDVSLADDAREYAKLRKQFDKAQGEAMRRDLGRRADEFQMPVKALEKALTTGAPPAIPANTRSGRSKTNARRLPTPPTLAIPTPRPARAPTPRPPAKSGPTTRPAAKSGPTRAASSRAATARPVSSRAATARPVSKNVVKSTRKSSRGDKR
jgi:hypothetical protein